MAASSLVDLVKIYATNQGTGALTLGEAVQGYRGVEALLNGATYSYSIQQDAQWEIGKATYLAVDNQLVRTPTDSSNGGGAVDFQANAGIAFVALSEDILARDVLQPLYGFGPPLPGQGLVGQTYTDITTPVTLYGPKTAAGWGLGVRLQGADGQDGAPGPADNTYTSLANLAASDTARRVASLAAAAGQPGIRYYWTPGDFTGQVDGVSVVASTATPPVPVSQGAWVDPLRQPSGFTLVKYKRSETGTFARSAQQLERIGAMDGQISIMHWVDPALDEGILTASNGTAITASLQAAFDYAPLDRPLIFPSGEIRTTSTVYNPRALSMDGNGCIWRFYGNDAAADILAIEANRDVRNFFLRNFANISPSFAARHAVRMFSDGVNRALIGFDISNNLISGGSGGNALNLGGLGTHIGSVWNNQLIEGVYDYGADRIAYTENNFFGLKTAITLDKIAGAFNTIIQNNAMVSRDGGVNVLNGDMILIEGNQIEQFPSYGANQSAFGSQITGYGQARPARSVVVRGNNLAGGGNCLSPVTLVANTRDWIFEDNQFAIGSTGLDVRILSDSCKYTAFRENFFRGTREGADAGDPISLFDNGAATRGAWKGAAGITFSGGWSAGTDFSRSVSPEKDTSVRFTGILVVGSSAAVGDTVMTLPEGYKPRAGQLLLCGNGANNDVSKLMVGTDGAVKVAGPMPAQGTALYLPPGGYRSRVKDTYEPGVV